MRQQHYGYAPTAPASLSKTGRPGLLVACDSTGARGFGFGFIDTGRRSRLLVYSSTGFYDSSAKVKGKTKASDVLPPVQ